jgi:hypothetical protein
LSSKRRVTTFLNEEDFDLFCKAVKAYHCKDSKLAREIIHAWLFANKLQVGGAIKNG